MPIAVQYQPSAAAVGNAAYAAGAENRRRYDQQQALQYQELNQRADLTREGYANQRAMQGQQLDYNARAAALQVLANQNSQARQFEQQRYLQDDAQTSAAQLQDQRLRYDYQSTQDQLASRAALQQQALGAAFAQQYLGGQQRMAEQTQRINAGLYEQQMLGQQRMALGAQNIAGRMAENSQLYQQRIDFSNFQMDAQSEAELNKIRQARARVEQMKLSGELNSQQYAAADAEIKARELGLARSLPQQQNQEFGQMVKDMLYQDPETGATFMKDPDTGLPVLTNIKPDNSKAMIQMKEMEYKQKQEEAKFKYQSEIENKRREHALDIFMKQMEQRVNPDDPMPNYGEIYTGLGPFYDPTGQGFQQYQMQQQQALQQRQAMEADARIQIPKNMVGKPLQDGKPIKVIPGMRLPIINTRQEILDLPPGAWFIWEGDDTVSQKAGTPDSGPVSAIKPGSPADTRFPQAASEQPVSAVKPASPADTRKPLSPNIVPYVEMNITGPMGPPPPVPYSNSRVDQLNRKLNNAAGAVGVQFPNKRVLDTTNVPTWRQYFGLD